MVETKIIKQLNPAGPFDDVFGPDPDIRLDLIENYDDRVSIEIETGSEAMSETDEKCFAEQEMCIVFICGNKTNVPHQVGFHR